MEPRSHFFAPSVLALLLLAPLAEPLAAPAPPGSGADPGLWFAERLLLGEAPPAALPTSTRALLDALGWPTLDARAAGGVEAYFAAVGLVPDAREHAALDSFRLEHPAVAAEIERLASEVALATRLSNDAFAGVPIEGRARLAELVARAAAGRLEPRDRALVAAVDLDSLEAAAARLTHAALEAEVALPKAVASDRVLAEVLAATHGGDAGAILSAVARDAAVARGTPRADLAILPPDLARAVQNLLAAIEGGDGPTVLATVAGEIPTLARAGALLEEAPPVTTPRGLAQALRVSGDDGRAGPLLASFTGAAEPARVRASLPQGFERLRGALGLDAGDGETIAALEARLGADLADAIGALLAAEAAYLEASDPERPLALRLAEADRRVGNGEIDALRERTLLGAAWRATLGARAAAVAEAARELGEKPVPSGLGTIAAGVALYDDGYVLILGPEDDTLDADARPFAPVLLVDLGGDDTYRSPVAAVAGETLVLAASGANPTATTRVSVAVDLAGDDLYDVAAPVALAAARGAPYAPALAILHDAGGADRYVTDGDGPASGRAGFGVLVDVAGSDRYETRVGSVATAAAAGREAPAAGILLDLEGDDVYASAGGFSQLLASSEGPFAFAALLDLRGRDAYPAACPPSEVGSACFAGPRGDPSTPGGGAVAFWDAGGVNTYPAGGILPATGATAAPDGPRAWHAADGTGAPVADEQDQDGIPEPLDGDGARRDGLFDDTDGDGVSDALESVLGTDADDPGSRPVDVAALASAAGGARPGGLLLDLPGRVAIGLPGPTTYRGAYALTLDLGLDDDDLYLNATAADGVAIDLGGNDRYAPAAGLRLASSVTGPALLLDLGGDDRYEVNDRSLAYAQGPRSFALLLDIDGDDVYRSANGTSQAYSVAGGTAWFIDRAGDDAHVGDSHGFVKEPGAGGAAVFLERAGHDRYVRESPLAADAWDAHQGAVGSSSTPPSPAGYASAPFAAFLDLDGDDTYTSVLAPANATTDHTATKSGRVRLAPVDGGPSGLVALFADVTPSASDEDGDGPDLVEYATGSDSKTPAAGFFLWLPRLGIAVGAADATLYAPGDDLALVVDLGGDDTYLNRIGASTPRFPAALALDLAGLDTYLWNGTTSLAEAFAPRWGATRSGLDAGVALAAAQGSGVLGVGVLRDAGGPDTFSLVAEASCEPCTAPTLVASAGQGAGLLGVGVLSLGQGGKGSVLNASAVARGGPYGDARTHAQGAGILGLGLVVSESRHARDVYTLAARSNGTLATNATTGQGYGLAGLGVLLDAGGDNRFVARRLAQGAVDVDPAGSVSEPVAGADPVTYALSAKASRGLLILPGIGNDVLLAEREAQAFAAGAGVALLVDAEGDDERTLEHGSGQGAAGRGGVAILVDHRGDDATVAGHRAQGFADQGFAAHLDFAGHDRYEAGSEAQGHLSMSSNAEAGWAAFLDRAGHDAYVLSGRGQGSWTSAVGGARGLALFVDAGGVDRYEGVPPGQTPAPGAAATRPADGNDWAWLVPSTDPIRGVGVDDGTLTRTIGSVYALLAPTAGARLVVRAADGSIATGPVSGTTRLEVWGEALGTRIPPESIDRVDLLVDDVPIGPAARHGTLFDFDWRTTGDGADGRPRFPDGVRRVEAQLHPRIGTPLAADATGVRVAADGEPLRAVVHVPLDNPPPARKPQAPDVLSLAHGPVPVHLRVDRDLERDACPACEGLPHLAPAADAWSRGFSAPPLEPVENVTGTGVTPVVVSAASKVYLSWSAPTPDPASVVAYRVLRRDDAASTFSVAGFVDARTAAADPEGLHRVVDAPALGVRHYRVDTLRAANGVLEATPSSEFVVTVSPSGAGPATGLSAFGTEGGVALAWRAAPGADAYAVVREAFDGSGSTTLATVDASPYVDTTAAPDTLYRYRVVARAAGAATPVSTPPVVAAAVPGHAVTLKLVGASGNVSIVENASVGGDATHRFDVSTASDGAYFLVSNVRDGAGRGANTTRLVLVDSTAPTTKLESPRFIGRRFLNETGVLALPLAVGDSGSGAARSVALVRTEGGNWTLAGHFSWTEGAATGVLPLPTLADGDAFDLVAATIDRAGNVDGPEAHRPWPVERNRAEDGAAARVVSGEATRHVLDFSEPQGTGSSVFGTVRAGEAVRFWVAPSDVGTGLARVVGVAQSTRFPLVASSDGALYTGTWIASGKGLTTVAAELADHADNVVLVSMGLVTVDPDPPTVASARVAFPQGRDVGRAGEAFDLHVVPHDEFTSASRVVVEVDFTNVSSRGLVRLVWGGPDEGHVARGVVVDRLPDTGEGRVTITLRDEAGNVANATLAIAVDATPVSGAAPSVVAAGPTWAVLNWTTNGAAVPRVDYGETAQLGRRSDSGARGVSHTVRLEGLAPDTVYFARAVSATASGVETRSEALTFRTAPAFTVTATFIEGFPATATRAKLVAHVRDPAGAPAVADVDAVLVPPRGPSRIVASSIGQADPTLEVNLVGVRDGDYHLVLKARLGNARGESVPLPLTLDRVAPALALGTAGSASVGAVLALVVEERGSGVDLANASWTFDGQACAPFLDGDRLQCVVPALPEDGDAALRLVVPDRAGNVARLEVALPVDATAPRFLGLDVGAADGHAHVRPGGRAVLTVRLAEAAVRDVTVDLGAIRGASVLALVARDADTFEAAFTVPATIADGPHTLRVVATDAAGRRSDADVTLVVDGRAPAIEDAALTEVRPTKAVLAVRTNEATTLDVRGGTLRASAAPTGGSTHHLVEVADLAPGATTTLVIAATDRAGQETTRVVTVATPPDLEAPEGVEGLEAVDLGDGRVRLRWDPARDDVGIAGYRVERGVDSLAVLGLASESGTGFEDVLAPVGRLVRYRVAAVDVGGNVGPSAEVSLRPRAAPTLSAGVVEPPVAGPGTYEFRVVARDPTGARPVVTLHLDDVAYPMATEETGCVDGCLYRVRVAVGVETLESGPHRFAFRAALGDLETRFPGQGTAAGPLVLAGAPAPKFEVLTAASRLTPLGVEAILGLFAAILLFSPRRRSG